MVDTRKTEVLNSLIMKIMAKWLKWSRD